MTSCCTFLPPTSFLPRARQPQSGFRLIFFVATKRVANPVSEGESQSPGKQWVLRPAQAAWAVLWPSVPFLLPPCSLDPYGPSFLLARVRANSRGPSQCWPQTYLNSAWVWHRAPGSADGLWVGLHQMTPAAHLPGFLADPGWALQPLLASCSVNMARLMVRNCQSPIGWDCFEDVLKIRTGRPAQPSAHHRMFSWQGFHRAAGNHNHRVNHS